MSRLQVGDQAPPFDLPSMNGVRVSLADVLLRGPLVLAFFKVSCPTSQFTFPFLERLFEDHGERVTFLGISQDDDMDTREFCEEVDVTFPILLESEDYTVSNEYGITNMPTFYLIGQDGKIQVECVGFGRRAIEEIGEKLERFLGKPLLPVFQPGEIVPETKSGCGSKN